MNEFALKLQGRQAALISSHLLLRPELECAIETCTQFAGRKSASSDLPHAAFTDPRQSSLHPSTAQRCDRTQAGSLCYINAVASSLKVHGDSSQDRSGRPLDSNRVRSSSDVLFINSPEPELEEMEMEAGQPGPGQSRQKTDCHRGSTLTCNSGRGNNRLRNNGPHEN
jgi:hypothetical protein